MTATEYRRHAADAGITHGSGVAVDCADLAEAERYVHDFPADSHGFAAAAHVKVPYTDRADTIARLCATLSLAGYTAAQTGDGWWATERTRAYPHYNRHLETAGIFVYHAEEAPAFATGQEGYLPPEDNPLTDG